MIRLALALALAGGVAAQPGSLRVSGSQRSLVTANGKPFFFLADTAWQLFHRCNAAEADRYLRDRQAKGFTVIQACVLAPFLLDTPNRLGHTALVGRDPARPRDAFFRHVDAIVDRCAALGMYVAMLPTWGSYVVDTGDRIFNATNARVYGEYLGRRYRSKPIIWVLGGDRTRAGFDAVWRAMARGIAIGVAGREDYGQVLMTYHPQGNTHSSTLFHAEVWLDFNMVQSGHDYNRPNHDMIARDWARRPVKPTMDGEPNYEDAPARLRTTTGRLDDYDVRKAAYWSLLAGAHGHTYGCHDIWQFWQPGRKGWWWPRGDWRASLNKPGARQMRHVRTLIESRPLLRRIPDQALIAAGQGAGTHRVQAARGNDGSYAFVYAASGNPITIRTGRLSGSRLRAWWFDPRTGGVRVIATFGKTATRRFVPPSRGTGNDWVLAIDDVARGYRLPIGPGAYARFGQGCAGRRPSAPVLASPDVPAIGRSMQVNLRKAQAGVQAVLLFGARRTSLDLTPLGAPGCVALAEPTLSIGPGRTGGAGGWRPVFAIPNDPRLLGGVFFNQFVVLDAGANALGALLSNGGEGTVGR